MTAGPRQAGKDLKVSLKVIKVEFVRAALVRKEGLTDEQSSSLIKTEKLTIKETNMPHSMANISRKFPELKYFAVAGIVLFM